jgi:hypothetical protein
MMMKMLAEAGVPIITDEIRNADEDNPNGYFEYELVKQLSAGQNKWLLDANGKAVKIISALLEHLPEKFHYKVIFMQRENKEILASQQKMLTRRNEVTEIDDTDMQKQFEKHLAAVKYWLARQPNIDVFYADYTTIMANPDESCAQIMEFLGIPLNLEKMRSVPNVQLYRNHENTSS